MFDSPNMEMSAGCYEVNLGLIETETDITSLTPEIYVYDEDKLVENPTFTWTNSDETIAVRNENGKITAKKAGTTYITGLYKDSKLLIKVNVYRTKLAKDPAFIEAMNGNTLSLSYLKGMQVEDVFFNGKSVLHSYKNGTVKLDSEKLPELGTRGELMIQTDKAEYIMQNTMVCLSLVQTKSEQNTKT